MGPRASVQISTSFISPVSRSTILRRASFLPGSEEIRRLSATATWTTSLVSLSMAAQLHDWFPWSDESLLLPSSAATARKHKQERAAHIGAVAAS